MQIECNSAAKSLTIYPIIPNHSDIETPGSMNYMDTHAYAYL